MDKRMDMEPTNINMSLLHNKTLLDMQKKKIYKIM